MLIAALLWPPAARADTPVKTQNAVNVLLANVTGSSCVFYRNGSW
jgi:Family of unknown function (DUF5329)